MNLESSTMGNQAPIKRGFFAFLLLRFSEIPGGKYGIIVVSVYPSFFTNIYRYSIIPFSPIWTGEFSLSVCCVRLYTFTSPIIAPLVPRQTKRRLPYRQNLYRSIMHGLRNVLKLRNKSATAPPSTQRWHQGMRRCGIISLLFEAVAFPLLLQFVGQASEFNQAGVWWWCVIVFDAEERDSSNRENIGVLWVRTTTTIVLQLYIKNKTFLARTYVNPVKRRNQPPNGCESSCHEENIPLIPQQVG